MLKNTASASPVAPVGNALPPQRRVGFVRRIAALERFHGALLLAAMVGCAAGSGENANAFGSAGPATVGSSAGTEPDAASTADNSTAGTSTTGDPTSGEASTEETDASTSGASDSGLLLDVGNATTGPKAISQTVNAVGARLESGCAVVPPAG